MSVPAVWPKSAISNPSPLYTCLAGGAEGEILRRGDGERREGTGGGRRMEEDPGEHIHSMGERAPAPSQHLHQRSRDRLLKRAQVDRPAGGAVRKEDASAQQEANVQKSEAGERQHSSQLSRGRGGDTGQH